MGILDLGVIGGHDASGANAINKHGEAVGWSGEEGKVTHAAVWRSGKIASLHPKGRLSSEAAAINDKSEVCGWYGTDADTNSRPCFWRNRQMRELDTLPGRAFGQANSINAKGRIVGLSYNSDGSGRKDQTACLWQNSKPIPLNLAMDEGESEAFGLNDKGQVVGWFNWMRDYKGFHYRERSGQAVELTPLEYNWWGARNINDAGQIVGQSDIGPETIPGYGYVSHACLWQHGKPTHLGTLGGGKSMAMGINRSGQIVGWSFINDHPRYECRAFLWQKSRMSDLNTTLPKNSGWVLERANGINDKGQIVGTGLHNGQRRAFLLTP